MPAPDRLTVITHRYAGSVGDQALVDVASFYGVTSELFDLDKIDLREILDWLLKQGRPCAAISASALANLTSALRRRLKNHISHTPQATLLIHSIHPDLVRGAGWLRDFLDMEATLSRPPEDRRIECHFTKKNPEWTGPLTGAVIGRVDPANDALLQLGRGLSTPQPILTPGPQKVGGELIAGSCRLGEGTVFLHSSRPPGEEYLEDGMAAWLTPARVTRLLPFFLFVRYVFGAACWLQPRPRAAFVWPGARLVQRPAEFDLRDLAEEAVRLKQHVCLAMPPSEYENFDPSAAKILRQYLHQLSVVPYGYEGTPDELNVPVSVHTPVGARPAARALRRMSEFGQQAKAVWGKVMVVPAGPCHLTQTADLRRFGFRMLVGVPARRSFRSPWAQHEGLEPASLDCGAFPIVPLLNRDLPQQALIGAFLGKPMVLEFRPEWLSPEGETSGKAVMELLSTLEVQPVWTDLETLSRSLYLKRRCGASVEIRMFSDEVVVEEIDLTRQTIEVIPPLTPTERFERVALDGVWEGRWRPTPAGDLQFRILDETSLRLTMRCEPPDLSSLPLGKGKAGILGRIKGFVSKSAGGLFKSKTR